MAPSAKPRIDSVVTLADGRRLAYADWGASEGRPVILHHGSPGSRLMCPDLEATEAAGIRLISVDRPGYGGSDPRPGRSTVDFVSDVAQLCDQLELGACPVVGWSGGGGYALACTWADRERFPMAVLVASPGPRSEMAESEDGLTEYSRQMAARIRSGDRTAEDEVRMRLAPYAENPRAMLAEGPKGPDGHLFSVPEVVESLGAMWEEGARQGLEGRYSDWEADALGWGFPLEEVKVPVDIWHGTLDQLVPESHGHYLAARLPSSELHLVSGVGHAIAVIEWAAILESLD